MEQHRVGHDAVRVAHKGGQERVLGPREVEVSTVERYAAMLDVDSQPACAKDRHVGAGMQGASERDADAREQLLNTERLGEVVIRAQVERLHLVTLRLAG